MADTEMQDGAPDAPLVITPEALNAAAEQIAAVIKELWQAMLATMQAAAPAIREAARQHAAASIRPPAEERAFGLRAAADICDGLAAEQSEVYQRRLAQGIIDQAAREAAIRQRAFKLARDKILDRATPTAPLATHYPGDGQAPAERLDGVPEDPPVRILVNTAPPRPPYGSPERDAFEAARPLGERLAEKLDPDEPECRPYVEALNAVLAVHVRTDDGMCEACFNAIEEQCEWPCPTVDAVTGALLPNPGGHGLRSTAGEGR